MGRMTTHRKLIATGVVAAVALLAPVEALGADSGPNRPERAGRITAAAQTGTPAALASPDRTASQRPEQAEGRPSASSATATHRRGGLGWREMGIMAGIFLGIVLMGIWGDVVVGALVVGAVVPVVAAARLGGRILRSTGRRENAPVTRAARPAGGRQSDVV